MDFAIIIPVYNEAGNIRPLVEEISAAIGCASFELIYVDDCSSDETRQQILELRPRHPWLRLIRHHARCGQSTALRTGVKAARAPIIATLDGDGQNDPADIPRLLATLANTAGIICVCGHRRRRHDSGLKKLSSKVANGIRARLLKDDTPDTGCGLKVFYRGAFLDLPYFDHMHRFLPALFRRAGGRTVSVEVNHRPRHAGRSKYGLHNRLWVGIVDLLGMLWLQQRAKLTETTEE
jgi:dolichol-phosphate mannosyltransferase